MRTLQIDLVLEVVLGEGPGLLLGDPEGAVLVGASVELDLLAHAQVHQVVGRVGHSRANLQKKRQFDSPKFTTF